jgi:hypothetical protein
MSLLKSLSDEGLWVRTREIAGKERAATVELLGHLREVDSRKLWAARGFGSLFEYVRRELGYSEGAAYRRIQGMRVMRDLPELAEKIASGAASLSSLAAFQGFVKDRSLSVKGKSRRETEQLLGDLSPEIPPVDRERVISSDQTHITFTADKDLIEKLEQLKNLLAHQNVDPSYGELFHLIADLALKKLVPTPPAEKRSVTSEREGKPGLLAKPRSRFVPVNVKRAVCQRDAGKCVYPGCGSRFMLEYDHIQPFAKGGTNTVENLRLLCRAHNQWRALSPPTAGS